MDVEVTAEGYAFISTLGADKGRTAYTPDEVATFLTDVKAGKWDVLLTSARTRAAEALTSV